MRDRLALAVIAAFLLGLAPASAQSIGIGPDGPRIDLRSRAQRERDYRRAVDRDRDDDRRRMDRNDRYDDRRRERRRMRRDDED